MSHLLLNDRAKLRSSWRIVVAVLASREIDSRFSAAYAAIYINKPTTRTSSFGTDPEDKFNPLEATT